MCLILCEEMQNSSGEILFSQRDIGPSRKFICTLVNETISPLGKTLDLLGETSIKPSNNTYN